jgi:energy-coupling factor transporter ATPase
MLGSHRDRDTRDEPGQKDSTARLAPDPSRQEILLTQPLVRAEGLYYSYVDGTREPVPALRGVDLRILPGEYVAIIGANGSGKSTLLRTFNALLLPSSGQVWVRTWNTSDAAHLRSIRSTVCMVFQQPDTQIVASTVEEDVAFGPENLGVPEEELRPRVRDALESVGLGGLETRASHLLSAGQKQRLAIAAALAMRPQCILFDEATSLLDPLGRSQLLSTMQGLCRRGLAVVTVTHNMLEAAQAQRVIVLSRGQVALEGDPHSVFAEERALGKLALEMPQPAQIAHALAQRVPGFPGTPVTVSELVEAVTSEVERRGMHLGSNAAG